VDRETRGRNINLVHVVGMWSVDESWVRKERLRVDGCLGRVVLVP
jgi:hypothetical protein